MQGSLVVIRFVLLQTKRSVVVEKPRVAVYLTENACVCNSAKSAPRSSYRYRYKPMCNQECKLWSIETSVSVGLMLVRLAMQTSPNFCEWPVLPVVVNVSYLQITAWRRRRRRKYVVCSKWLAREVALGRSLLSFFLFTIALFTHALPFCIQFPFSFAFRSLWELLKVG